MMKLIGKKLPYIGIAFLGVSLWGFLSFKHRSDIDQIRANYISEKTYQTEGVATKVEEAFKAFYQGLRTMTLLPGVQNIDRYGKKFQLDSKKAMQQIYNNTYLNVTLSEVYLLPKYLNHDAIDPNTMKPEEPILTFDEFITGGVNTEEIEEDKKPKLEEVEIFEYRLMDKQLSYLRSNFPTKSSFKDLNVPAIMGEPVITCDNSEFTQADLDSKNDKPRLGVVYTLPVYDDAGEFHGAVSGVVRVNVLEKLIPKGTVALSSKGNRYLGITDAIPVFNSSKKAFEEGRKNSDLIYSEIRKLNVIDNTSWELWAVAPNEEFTALPEVKQADLIYYSGIVVAILLSLGLAIAVRSMQQSQMKLELKVKEKTKELAARNDAMRLILDNSEEGFLTCTLDGRIGSEYSAIIEKWFGKPTRETKIWDLLMKGESEKRIGTFKGGWGQFVDDFLPFEVCAGQMPQLFQNGENYFEPTFTPIYDQSKKLVSILVVVLNVTEKVEAEKRDSLQQEILATFQALSKDRVGFLEYFSDAENMIKTLNDSATDLSKDIQFRLVHTLKGNSAQYSLVTLAEVCHGIESKLQEGDEPMTKGDIELLTNAWNEMSARLIDLIGNRVRKNIELDVTEYTNLLQRIKAGASHSEIVWQIERWRLEPAVKRLDRMAAQAKSLADRLNIENFSVITNDHGVRLEPEAFSDFWSSMIHIIRNSIDHGFGGFNTREPVLQLTTKLVGENMELSVLDNGAGIDWERVKEKAKKMSLPCETAKDLEACLFADGLSTKGEVTTVSGRGIGMAAIKQTVSEFAGTIEVFSKKGHGTEFKFHLPMDHQLHKASIKKAS